jgi:hypothetical protein
MSTTSHHKRQIQRGEEVAKDLGWREEDMGFAGAARGLRKIGGDFHAPRSAMRRVERYHRRSDERVKNLIASKIKRLSE